MDLADVAELVGIAFDSTITLDQSTLRARMVSILETLSKDTLRIPTGFLSQKFPGRDRTVLNLLNHIVEILYVFLSVCKGETFTAKKADAEPSNDLQPEELRARIRSIVLEILALDVPIDRPVNTYYGVQSFHQVMNRCTWHCAQHLRQIHWFLSENGISANETRLEPILEGLPLPTGVWD